MDKTNFICPACKKRIVVGKRLKSHYTCDNCNTQMLITPKEKAQGKLDYSKAKQYRYMNNKKEK